MKYLIKRTPHHKKAILVFTFFITIALFVPIFKLEARVQWSYHTHEAVVVNAIYSLPSPWNDFFINYADFIAEHSDDPDEYRSWCKSHAPELYEAEAPRHYDDHNLKEYGGIVFNELAIENSHLIDGNYTIEDIDFVSVNVPVSSNRYQKGVIEWTVDNFTKSLTEYMRYVSIDPTNNTAWQIVLASMSWLSHYIADATMPFHATANYDGQFTGQYGIHSAIESTLLSEYLNEIQFTHDEAIYILSPFNQTIMSIETGLSVVNDILEADKVVSPEGNRDATWNDLIWGLIGEIISERVNLAARFTANLWFTALYNSDLFTKLDVTDLNAIEIDISNIPDPWRPPIQFNSTVPFQTSSSSTQSTDGLTDSVINDSSTNGIVSWNLLPFIFTLSVLILLVRRKVKS